MSSKRRKWHFGVLSFTGTGHVTPFIVLSKELKDREHTVTFFEKPKIETRVRQAGLEFISVGINGFSGAKTPSGGGLWSEISTLRFNLKRIASDLETYLESTPPALVRAGVDALLVNELALTGPTVAELLGLPYFVISLVPHSFGWNPYRPFSGYRLSTSWLSPFLNSLLEVSAIRVHGPLQRVLNRQRRRLGLRPIRNAAESYPPLAQITQLPECLDFPRAILPANFYYAGPFIDGATRTNVDFPWSRLDGRPIVYASLGTTRNVQVTVLRLIAEACHNLGVQLVISLGGRHEPAMLAGCPGDPLVVKYAPQRELLRVAKVVITHGGANTVFEALMAGKPMVVIPLAYDQPAIAARLARLGLAEVLPVMRLSADQIRRALTALLHDSRCRDAAAAIQTKLQSLHGPVRAADIIEEALEKNGTGSRDELTAGEERAHSNHPALSVAPR